MVNRLSSVTRREVTTELASQEYVALPGSSGQGDLPYLMNYMHQDILQKLTVAQLAKFHAS
jgi:hypothetical protein